MNTKRQCEEKPMTVIRCPACGAPNRIAEAAVWRFKRLRCDACSVLMEIVTEHPLMAEWVPENWSYPDWILQDWTYEEVVGVSASRRAQRTDESRPAARRRTKKSKNAAKERKNA